MSWKGSHMPSLCRCKPEVTPGRCLQELCVCARKEDPVKSGTWPTPEISLSPRCKTRQKWCREVVVQNESHCRGVSLSWQGKGLMTFQED